MSERMNIVLGLGFLGGVAAAIVAAGLNWRNQAIPEVAPVSSLVSSEAQAADPASCFTDSAGQSLPEVCFVRVWSDVRFQQPVWVGVAPGDDGHRYVIERAGKIHVFQAESPTSTEVWVDLTDSVRSRNMEEGLLSMAFHPEFAQNRRVFLYQSRSNPRRTVLSEFKVVGESPGRFDVASERLLLNIEQPYGNHNGGDLVFGNDGFLYLGVGDGGSGGDPQGHGQNTGTLLGTILRVDVDSGSPYAIPSDNPFADGKGGRPEIYAWGMRNPWRLSVDRPTGMLWVGDVGQNAYEEVDIIRRGGNYGWNIAEAKHCYNNVFCSTEGLIDPVFEYGRSQGISITGGHVYRGKMIAGLQGAYVFGDFGSGNIWGVCSTGDEASTQHRVLHKRSGLQPSSFGMEPDGELLLTDFSGGGLYRLMPTAFLDSMGCGR